MPEMFSARIPYESLDPLTIGAAQDDSMVRREELEIEFPRENLLAAIYPDEPPPVPLERLAKGAPLLRVGAGPEDDGLVVRPRGEGLAVGTERQTIHIV